MDEQVLDYELKQVNAYTLVADTALLIGFGLIGGLFVPMVLGTFHRGFFCNDQSIMYIYRSDTVTTTMLLMYAFLVMIMTITATESYRAKRQTPILNYRYKVGNTYIHTIFAQILRNFGYSIIGLVCVLVLTQITKCCVGRLRPHFLDVCRPLNFTCRSDQYYSDYICTGDPLMVEEARKSFFSGHSSISMYASTFSALYLLARVPRHSIGRVFLPVSQTALLAIGLLISLSRINDNKHHWSDVIIGILVGMSIAVYTCYVWAGMFAKQRKELLPTTRQHTDYRGTATSNSTHTISLQTNVQPERSNGIS
ncbi:unnamed protein product [Cylicocyclus nassatus]|uniref:Phosphatidic acid phosphatase type 2/haloperoxidase domain-containing protein n=1 Tax=Cylicocyclus nassatus TaxID=53992 RepID=A0AA36MDT6_CYLNA|nr:unnamed protein product [Cylicocyclus nassatus]